VLTIVNAFGFATIQDRGRHGFMHEAVPPGGALVPELLVAANRRARNRDDAAAIEIFGALDVRADAAIAIATDREAIALAAGDAHRIESHPRRVAYLAIRGGVEAPVVLGGRGALVSAGIGSRLRVGDRVASANAPEVDAASSAFDDDGDLRVIPGPDLDAFADDALAVLASSTYRVSTASDRVGTRLEGPPLSRRAGYVERSRPMVRGAIEVPRDGLPIVLGHDHPTTGGYPIIGVIASEDLGRFFAIPLGGAVKLTE
jgi:allophanate hydrolase subunit 2